MVVKKKVIAEDEELVVYRNGKRIVVIDKVEKEKAPIKTPKEENSSRKG